MERKRTLSALIEFLDYMSKKGLMNQTTAGARRTAVLAVFSVLDEEDREDVTKVDLDHAMVRFENLQGKNFTPDSLRTYQSRLRSAIGDFSRYLENPLAFRPSIQSREKRSTQSKSSDVSVTDGGREKQQSDPPKSIAASVAGNILPIPIRADLTIFIQGIPFDLTVGEAKRIAGVVQALAVE